MVRNFGINVGWKTTAGFALDAALTAFFKTEDGLPETDQ